MCYSRIQKWIVNIYMQSLAASVKWHQWHNDIIITFSVKQNIVSVFVYLVLFVWSLIWLQLLPLALCVAVVVISDLIGFTEINIVMKLRLHDKSYIYQNNTNCITVQSNMDTQVSKKEFGQYYKYSSTVVMFQVQFLDITVIDLHVTSKV